MYIRSRNRTLWLGGVKHKVWLLSKKGTDRKKMMSMKIVLSNAPWHMAKEGKMYLGIRAGSRWPFLREYMGSMVDVYKPFPFFLATASAMLKEAGFDVIIRDSITLGESYEEYYEFLRKVNPDYLMLETATPSITNDLSILRTVKGMLPEIKTILAGIHTLIEETSFLEENKEVDYAIYGEYEHPLLLLMQAKRDGISLSEVPNLLYRDSNGEVQKTARETLMDLKDMPWPDRDSLPDTYYDGCCGMPGKELQVHTSRGCPYRCNFCAWPQFMYNHKYRTREPQDVVNEIVENFKKVKYTHFYIDDDTINISKKHFMELCKCIKEAGLDKYQWGCMGRADIMDDEMINAMKEAGCYSIKYGVENFNQEILDRTGKSMNIEKNIENIIKTREAGIKVHLTYCLGLLGDTKETVEYTVEKSLELLADERQYSLATPYPGSVLWNELKEKGLLLTEDFSKFDGNNISVVSQEGLSAEELMRIRDEAEKKSILQISNLIPAPMATSEFDARCMEAFRKNKKVLVTGTAQRAVVKKIYRLLVENGISADILTHARFLREYEEIKDNDIISFWEPAFFCKEEMQDLISQLQKTQYDAVAIPSRAFETLGMENVIEIAQEVTNNVWIIFGNGRICKL